nr:hypothetical protein [Pandoravirus aubagnensis]
MEKKKDFIAVASNPFFFPFAAFFLCRTSRKEHTARTEKKRAIHCRPKSTRTRHPVSIACGRTRGEHVVARSCGLGAKRTPRGVPNKKGSRAHATRCTRTPLPGGHVRVYTHLLSAKAEPVRLGTRRG